jgi:hypothetical protein
LPAFLPYLILAALLGAIVGAGLSVAKFDATLMLRALGLVLGLAAIALAL